MLATFSEPTLVALVGFLGGICLGRLSALNLLNLNETLALTRLWNPLASIVGGLLFGYGMALSGLSSLRIWAFGGYENAIANQSIAGLLSDWSALPIEPTGIAIGILILIATLANRELRDAPKYTFWGAVVGLAIVSGWAGTTWIATEGFDATPIVSHTFSAPIGETMLYMMTSSGNAIGFGTGSVFGVLTGAFLGSLFKGQFRWEACEDPRELRRQILGAALMGVGAVVAVGCSVGQGLSAFSTLAFSAPVTLAAIMAGAAIGLRQLIVGFRAV